MPKEPERLVDVYVRLHYDKDADSVSVGQGSSTPFDVYGSDRLLHFQLSLDMRVFDPVIYTGSRLTVTRTPFEFDARPIVEGLRRIAEEPVEQAS